MANQCWNFSPQNGRMQDLALMVDVTEHLNNLNKMLQGRNKVVTQYYDSMCSI